MDDRVNMSKPDDFSYVAAGYAPLLARIVQMTCSASVHPTVLAEGMKLLPGPFLDFVQPTHAEELVDLLKLDILLVPVCFWAYSISFKQQSINGFNPVVYGNPKCSRRFLCHNE